MWCWNTLSINSKGRSHYGIGTINHDRALISLFNGSEKIGFRNYTYIIFSVWLDEGWVVPKVGPGRHLNYHLAEKRLLIKRSLWLMLGGSCGKGASLFRNWKTCKAEKGYCTPNDAKLTCRSRENCTLALCIIQKLLYYTTIDGYVNFAAVSRCVFSHNFSRFAKQIVVNYQHTHFSAIVSAINKGCDFTVHYGVYVVHEIRLFMH